MTTTLPLFWNLSSANKKERLDASVKLVGALEEFQIQFAPSTPPEIYENEDGDGDEASKQDNLDLLNAQDVSYAIRRLVRGLASPRESSRLGFAVALTELLSRIDTVSCPQIIALIRCNSQTSGSMTGQEERDVLFARLFGLTSVIQSGLLVRKKPLPISSTIPSTKESFQAVVTELLALGEKKSWLRESCWWTLALAIDAVHSSDVPWKDQAVDALLDNIFVQDKGWTPEKVAVTLKLQSLYPSRDWQKLTSPTFKNPDLLSTSNLVNLGRILKESSIDEGEDSSLGKSNSGSWRPRLHLVWDAILDTLLSPEQVKASSGKFEEFFRIVVDETLFSSSSSPERKYWGFQVLQRALQRLSPSELRLLFTQNFMRSWINHLSKKDRYLHKIAAQLASDIQSVVAKNPTAGFTLVLQLTGANGAKHFDRITRTKTVESILASMDLDGIKRYIAYLFKQVNEGDEANSHSGVDARRIWIIEQLAALIRQGSIPKDDEWIMTITNWLTTHGFYVVVKKSEKDPNRALHIIPEPPFSDETRELCRTKLLSCLAELTSQASVVRGTNDTKFIKTAGAAADGELWIIKVLNTVSELEKDHKHVRGVFEINEEDRALRKKALKSIYKLAKASNSEREAARGAELLLAAILLRHYGIEKDVDADKDTLETCIDGIAAAFPSDKKSKDSKSNITTEIPPVDILVDIVIGLLENSTAYTRTVANQVFAMLTGLAQESTVELIISQLEVRDPGNVSDDESEDMGSIGEEPEIDDQDKSSEEDTDGEEEGSEDEEAVTELRKKLDETFRDHGAQVLSGSSDGESSVEELMDDDQMMQIDEQLAAIFRSRTNEKKAGKDSGAQREATHFKNRILDLVDIFIRKQPTSKLLIRLVLPLVDIIAGTGFDERQLSDKATSILRSRLGKLKEVPVDSNDAQISEILETIHQRARKVHSPDILTTLSHCSMYLSKVLLGSAEKSVIRIYRESLLDFATRKASSLQPNFILDFVRRYPLSAWQLRSDLLESTRKAVNGYRTCQTFNIIQNLITGLPSSGDRGQEIIDFMKSLRQALQQTISKSCTAGESTLTAIQLKEVFKVGLQAIRQTKKTVTDPLESSRIWDPESWDELVRSIAASERFKSSTSLQALCRQMASASQDTEDRKNPLKLTSSKRKVDEEIDTPLKKTKRKKAKKSHKH